MKKRFNLFIIFSIIILLIVSLILIIHFTRPPELFIYGITKHYSQIYDEMPTLKVNAYVTNSSNDYFNLDSIEKTTITAADDIFQVKIIEANITSNLRTIKDKETYEAYYVIKFDFSSDEMIQIRNATLNVTYKTSESLSMNIGNICFQKAKSDDGVRISKIQSIVNDLGGIDSVVAVNIELDPFDDCQLINIIPLSASLGVNNDYILEDSTLEIDNETSINDLLGDYYNPYLLSTKPFNAINLKKNLMKKIVVPLQYGEKEFVDSIGFIIVLKINDQVVKQIINPYCLFSTSNLDYATYECQIVKN